MTITHSAGQSSVQKRQKRVSKKLAQLASDEFSAGLPKRSQVLRRRTFRACSELGEDGPCCSMARRMVCCASCKANRTRMAVRRIRCVVGP